MTEWPAGHRWEDYRIDIISNAQVVLGSLGTVHNLKGQSRLYGGYKAKMTFSLEKSDPWASVLNESKTHFCAVYRDGVRIWSGVQVNLKRSDEQADDDEQTDAGAGMIDFEFLHLSQIARWRYGMPVPPAIALTVNGKKLDDAMKWVVERTLGATAPDSPTSHNVRAFTNFVVAADKTQYPDTLQLVATFDNIYEVLERVGAAHQIDWEIFWNASGYPEFETWYPRRGLDKSEGNGARTEVILTDKNGAFTSSEYAVDTADMVTIAYDALMSEDQAAAAGTQADWLVRDLRVKSTDDLVIGTALVEHDAKISVKLKDFVEQRNCLWDPGGTADIGFDLGDLITWRSLRMGYGPTNDIICGINWEIDEDGYEHLEILLGDPTPEILEKMRGGGVGKWSWKDEGIPWGVRDDDGDLAVRREYDNSVQIIGANGVTVQKTGDDTLTVAFAGGAKGLLYLKGDNSTLVGADATYAIRVHSDTPGYAFTEDAANSELDFTGPWTRITVGAEYLRPTAFGDAIKVFDDVQGLSFHITGDGDVYGNEQALGTPFRLIALSDYDMVASDHDATKAGLHDLTVSGNIISQIDTTGSAFKWLGGSDGEDTVQVRNWSVYSNTAGTTLRAQYNISTGLRVMEADGTTVGFQVAATAGHTTWMAGAKWTIEGDQYTLPTAYPGTTGMALIGTDAGVLTWGNPLIATPGTLTAATTNSAAAPHTHAVTTTVVSAASTIVATDASGYIRATRLEVGGTTYYIDKNGANVMQLVAANTLDLIAGGTTYRFQGAGGFSAGVTWGASGARFSTVYSVDGNFSGDVTIGTAAKGLIMSANTQYMVPLADGTRFVPSALPKAALPTHGHAITYTSTASSSWTAGTPITHTLEVTNSGTEIWVYTALTSGGGTPAWRKVHVPTSPHTHLYDKADSPTGTAIV